MTLPEAEVLVVRCLNETRIVHPPTYVACRYLADSIISDSRSMFGVQSIMRKYPLQGASRFGRYLRYKKTDNGGRHEYREFLIPSPWTCFAESVVLSILSATAAFQKSASIYSYIWPQHAGCPYNFEHYSNGYKKRNEGIASFLTANPGYVALIADIERFYPRIRHDALRRRFHARLNASSIDNSASRTTVHLLDHLLSYFPRGQGIPTGPEFSHVLGDVSLAEVDRALEKKFRGRYFRYVDDFVILVKPNEIDFAKRMLADLLSNEGLTANMDKDDIISSDEWLSFGPRMPPSVTEYSFEALVFRLKVFLAVHPHRYGELASALLGEGFNLPLNRIRASTQNASFRNRLTYLWRRGWRVAAEAVFQTPKTLVEYARVVRGIYRERLNGLAASNVPENGTRRRWHLQRLRYVTNRLLYLESISNLVSVRQAILPFPEFAETAALLRLLLDDDPTQLLEMPGTAVAAAASLLANSAEPRSPIQLPDRFSEAAVHSASVLLLYGVAKLPQNLLQFIKPSDRELLLFCAGIEPNARERDDFSYIDEIRSLQLQRTATDRLKMLSLKFSESETSELEALEIGENHFT